MARKLRIEFPDAVYHVLNRGNYRRDFFSVTGEAVAFVKALEEAAELFGWRVHAYAVMRNHYHLALRTPEPNLTEGMHWLQTTFATRGRAEGVGPIVVNSCLVRRKLSGFRVGTWLESFESSSRTPFTTC